MTNEKKYTDEDMFEEIKESIEEIGGSAIFVPSGASGHGGIHLQVEPQLFQQAQLIVSDIKVSGN